MPTRTVKPRRGRNPGTASVLIMPLPPCGQYRRCVARESVLNGHGTLTQRQCGRKARFRHLRPGDEALDVCDRHVPRAT